MFAPTQRLTVLLGALALLPVAAYVVDSNAPFVALSGVCVLVIVGSLWTMFGPSEGGAHA